MGAPGLAVSETLEVFPSTVKEPSGCSGWQSEIGGFVVQPRRRVVSSKRRCSAPFTMLLPFPRLVFPVALSVCALPGILSAQEAQSIGELYATDASVKGSVLLAGSGTSVLSGSSIQAGAQAATLKLDRGGSLFVCEGTKLTVNSSKNGRQLLLSLNSGNLELNYPLGTEADSLLTPDLQLMLPGPGTVHVAVRVDPNGDTCVQALPWTAAAVVVSESLGDATYQVKPDEAVLFKGGPSKISQASPSRIADVRRWCRRRWRKPPRRPQRRQAAPPTRPAPLQQPRCCLLRRSRRPASNWRPRRRPNSISPSTLRSSTTATIPLGPAAECRNAEAGEHQDRRPPADKGVAASQRQAKAHPDPDRAEPASGDQRVARLLQQSRGILRVHLSLAVTSGL